VKHPACSELVAEFAQRLFARFDVGFGFYPLALDAINNAENSSAVLRVRPETS
jgi:hypothetical protein